MTFIVLAGYPPFDGDDSKEIYKEIKKYNDDLDFEDEEFKNISKEAKQFIKKLLKKDFMKRHRVLYNIKEVISKLSDVDFNKIAQSVSKTPQEKLTLAKIFKSAVYKKPSLVFDVVRVLAGY